MHETYRILAQDRFEERLREAAAWRLADEARRASPRCDREAHPRARVAPTRSVPPADDWLRAGERRRQLRLSRRRGDRLRDQPDALDDLALVDGAVAEDQPARPVRAAYP